MDSRCLGPPSGYRIGEKIEDQFIVLEAPRIGGMGEVYKCKDEDSGGILAVKVLRGDWLKDPVMHTLLKRESAIWLELGKQRNIVELIGAHGRFGRYALISGWVHPDEKGRTSLSDWVADGPLPLLLALDFALDICRGLEHAQLKIPGIVHRDIKPSNILVGMAQFHRGLNVTPFVQELNVTPFSHIRETPLTEAAQILAGASLVKVRVAKINDWGLAKAVKKAAHPSGSQKHSNIAGTYLYMAPEQWLGTELSFQTDIYAVGCILYEMLTGAPPFFDSDPGILMWMHLRSAIPQLPAGLPSRDHLQHILERCLAKDPEDRYGHIGYLLHEMADVYRHETGNKPRALESDVVLYSAGDMYNRGLAYLSLEQYQRSMECFDEALGRDASLSAAQYGKAAVYRELGDYYKALKALDKAILQSPGNASYHAMRGTLNRQLERYSDALNDFGRAIALNGKDGTAHLNRGNMFLKLSQYDEALADYNAAARLLPKHPDVYRMRARAHESIGTTSRALRDINTAIRLDPADTEQYLRQASILADLGRLQRAVTACSRAIDFDRTCIPAYLIRADLRRRLGYLDDAAEDEAVARALEAAVDSEDAEEPTPANDDWRDQIADRWTAGDRDRAMQLAAEAAGRPESAEDLFSFGLEIAEMGDHERAAVVFSSILTLDPLNAEYLCARGRALFFMGQIEPAIVDLSSAISIAPADTNSLFARARCYDELGKLEQAESDYSTVISIKSDCHQAYFNRGLIRRKDDRAEEALEDFVAACQLCATDPDYYEFAGRIHYQRGEREKAAPYFERALRLGSAGAAAFALELRDELGVSPPENEDPLFLASQDFIRSYSSEDMQLAALRNPIMLTDLFISSVTQTEVEDQSMNLRRLDWLRQIQRMMRAPTRSE